MNYEERYKKALKVIEELYTLLRYQSSTDALLASQTIEKAFPELRESEDERIRKELISFFTKRDEFTKSEPFDGLSNKKIIAWLEKQKKLKDDTVGTFSYGSEGSSQLDLAHAINQTKEFLKQKPVEWSEEDEKMLNSIIDCLDGMIFIDSDQINWLKSLKPSHWKPSEEQMSMLLAVLNDSNNITAESVHIALKSLYNDIKKL